MPPTACSPRPARGRRSSSPISASSSDFTARTLFAKNFFEAGGIEAVSNDGFASRDAMIAAFKASGAKLACLCSSDKVYATEAADAAKALTAAGATHIYLAGRPGELEAALKAAGVQDFIYVGCDVLATSAQASADDSGRLPGAIDCDHVLHCEHDLAAACQFAQRLRPGTQHDPDSGFRERRLRAAAAATIAGAAPSPGSRPKAFR